MRALGSQGPQLAPKPETGRQRIPTYRSRNTCRQPPPGHHQARGQNSNYWIARGSGWTNLRGQNSRGARSSGGVVVPGELEPLGAPPGSYRDHQRGIFLHVCPEEGGSNHSEIHPDHSVVLNKVCPQQKGFYQSQSTWERVTPQPQPPLMIPSQLMGRKNRNTWEVYNLGNRIRKTLRPTQRAVESPLPPKHQGHNTEGLFTAIPFSQGILSGFQQQFTRHTKSQSGFKRQKTRENQTQIWQRWTFKTVA